MEFGNSDIKYLLANVKFPLQCTVICINVKGNSKTTIAFSKLLSFEIICNQSMLKNYDISNNYTLETKK